MLYKLLPLLVFFLLTSCDKTDNQPKLTPCDENILEQLGYEPYTGVPAEFNCEFFLNKFRFTDGEFYYIPNCHCCDLILRVFNCAGEDICDEDGSCLGRENAELIGIIGVRP